jgi:hypothetical protein
MAVVVSMNMALSLAATARADLAFGTKGRHTFVEMNKGRFFYLN